MFVATGSAGDHQLCGGRHGLLKLPPEKIDTVETDLGVAKILFECRAEQHNKFDASSEG
jgi:hypothetical protein